MIPNTRRNPTEKAGALVIGEALIDIVTTPEGTIKHPGGSPANVAYGLAKLGTATALWTALADDDHGDLLRAHLGGAGVEVPDWATPLPRTSTASVRLAQDGSARYNFDVDWTIQELTLPWLPALVHVGSVAAFAGPGRHVVEHAVRQCAGQSLVTFDPNIRPELIPPHADSLAIFERIAATANVVKLSDEDAHWLFPALNLNIVVQKILALGPELVVITQGAQGALLTSSAAAISVPSVPTTVADTIGAGDSYMAALIFSLLSVTDSGYGAGALMRLGRVAAAAAAITVSRAGANPPSHAELEPALI